MMNRRINKRRRLLGVWLALWPLANGFAEESALTDGKHMGVATCAASQCHGSALPRSGTGVLQNEYVTWTQADPHSRAYELLNNAQSQAIAARLKIGRAREAKICLDCHTDNVPPAERGDRFQLADGVGCEACHGGSEHWLSTHYNAPAVSHADNLKSGLYPADDAQRRADLCLDCHLGARDQLATHRIMAAGHPRLSFELDTFTELWRTAGRQPHYRVDADYRERKTADSHSFIWAAGLLRDARRRLALIRSPAFAGSGLFPELGFYDCHACHRSMKGVQWRALPRHGGAPPGQPFLNDGSFVTLLALTRTVAAAESRPLRDALADLHRAGGESMAAIRRAAASLDDVLLRIESRLSPERLQNRERQLLKDLLTVGAEGNYLDYASAEQAFMAVQMLVIEIDDPTLDAALEALADSLDDDERYRPGQFARLLADLDR
ncbi:MAG: cytochrome c family protein [Gammaproteobacteria bacterium]|nr:cytochrome c family protein [Gammaproteobacteria bacterium]